MKSERPVLLTVLCVAGFFFNGIIGPILVYSPEIQSVGKLYAIYRSLGFAFLVVCFYGLWNMRRWSLWALGIYFIINLAVGWVLGRWEPGNIGPLVILVAAFWYRRRMA